MEIVRYISDLLNSNMYVITEGKHSIIIDPFEHCILPETIQPDLMLITHEHYDHISGVNRMKQEFGISLMCSDACASRIVDPRKNSARYFDAFCELQSYEKQDDSVSIDTEYRCEADLTFVDEIKFKWHGCEIRMFELPGHSLGSTGILIQGKYFFSGDSLLPDCDVELRFPGGSREAWENISLSRINQLDENVVVFPGHRNNFKMKERMKNGSI